MVEIPDQQIAAFVIQLAREYGEYGTLQDTAVEGRHGEYDFDTEWSLADLSPKDCFVELAGDELLVGGEIEADYSVQVSRARYNPPGRAHPAEYENRSVPLFVTIEMPLNELPQATINAEIA